MSSVHNPLREPFDLRHGAVPFDRIEKQHFLPAIEHAIEQAESAIERILGSPSPPGFENTIVALDEVTHPIDRVAAVYYGLRGAHSDDDFKALAQPIGAMCTAFNRSVDLNPALFDRVRAVYEQRRDLDLTPEALRLLDRTFRRFVRNGALLGPADKERLQWIDQRLNRLRSDFSRNLASATEAFEYHTEDESELDGVPATVRENAARTAIEKGHDSGWSLTLQMPCLSSVMKYASSPALRERFARASGGIGFGGEHDNRAVIKEIARLAHERALLLGYENHAAYELESRMAASSETVARFRDRLFEVARPAAESELVEIREKARRFDGREELEPWDFAYYAEKLKQERFDFDDESLRPYLPLERVLAGALELIETLFALTFREASDLPVYHPDVRVFEVHHDGGTFLGLLYLDLLARGNKMGGAWKSCYRCQGTVEGRDQRPLVSITASLAPSTPTRPSLLSVREMKTLFHELGHAVHAFLSDSPYTSLNSCHVYRDFVELPSQLLQYWATEKEVLKRFAGHYETGEAIPEVLLESLEASDGFLAGCGLLGGVRMIDLDWAWFGRDPSRVIDVGAHEEETTRATRLFDVVEGTNISVSFRHIFGGGYAAGFYGYRWAELLTADAFELFTQERIVDPTVAARFRDEILSRGNSDEPAQLYRRFRGRDPDPDALLRRLKLLSATDR
ncbi:MAG: peptidase M3 [Gemmatimonadetes bacterium]|nr:peptidase M3 [Gemmatimonadota bacterium]